MAGWQAFVWACLAAWPGQLGSKWYLPVLAALSVLTTLLFIVGSPWVVLRGTRSLLRASASVALAAFLLNAWWLVWLPGLGVGYFVWWGSFVLLAIGLFGVAREG